MKTFETPYVEVKKFDVEDILTTSSPCADNSPTECYNDGCAYNVTGPCDD